jgi:hypothetical protein
MSKQYKTEFYLMIKTTVYQITPYLAEGYTLPNTKINNGTDWLRESINMVYNRCKERLKVAGVVTNLFHNHDEQSGQNIQRYPLIQYQKHKEGYFVVGLNEGAKALEELFIDARPVYTISDQLQIAVKPVFSAEQPGHETNKPFSYTLTNWLPFSSENYNLYKQMDAISEKVTFMELNLKNHLVKDFAHYLKLNLNTETVQVKLTEIENFNSNPVQVKVNRHIHNFQPFTIGFSTNVVLPRYICLGNGKAYGFGLVEAENVCPLQGFKPCKG